jgi:hypothetical protein
MVAGSAKGMVQVIAESVKNQDARSGHQMITPDQGDQRVDNRKENTNVQSQEMQTPSKVPEHETLPGEMKAMNK